jgi:hypothetical protein
MTSFLDFLRRECSGIQAFVAEFDESIEDESDIISKIPSYISHHPELRGYFDVETDVVKLDIGTEVIDPCQDDEDSHQRKKRWSRSLRVGIIDHLTTVDINISLLLNVVESYWYDLEIEELVEIVRSLDILGAELRCSEYEAVLYLKLKEIDPMEKEWRKICGDRLPVGFIDHVRRFPFGFTSSQLLGKVGSRRLIEYCLTKYHEVNKNDIFSYLCCGGHLSVAQWLYGLGGVNIHAIDEEAFRRACSEGHLLLAQWLLSLGDVNIQAKNNEAFRLACRGGHLQLAQWLYGLGNVDIHANDEEAFRRTCSEGHLLVAQWFYGLGAINIHVKGDVAFKEACSKGHLSIAQWLYGFGDVNIHVEEDKSFRCACYNGHLSIRNYRLGSL